MEESKENNFMLPELSNKIKHKINNLFKNKNKNNTYEYYNTLLTILEENIEKNFNRNNSSNNNNNKLLSNHLSTYVSEYKNIENGIINASNSGHLSNDNYNNLMRKIGDSIDNLTRIIYIRQKQKQKYINSLMNNSNYSNVD